jgi:putative FmdB family regulatory protein
MPIYEYLCPNCERKFDLMRPMSASSEPAPCPDCGTSSGRAISAFAFHGSDTFDDIKVDEGPASDLPDMSGMMGGHGHSHDHGHDHSHFH